MKRLPFRNLASASLPSNRSCEGSAMETYQLCFEGKVASAAMRSLTDFDIEKTLSRSRRLNRLNGVTGALLLTDTSIFQWLEGPLVCVLDTFECARADSRLEDTSLLLRRSAKTRIFAPCWMSFRDLRASPSLKPSLPSASFSMEDPLAAFKALAMEVAYSHPLRAAILV